MNGHDIGELQWVHGPITVVMGSTLVMATCSVSLQWVHGPITVVMGDPLVKFNFGPDASMGPRSDNRGYDLIGRSASNAGSAASMGPRSDNRGYARIRLSLN